MENSTKNDIILVFSFSFNMARLIPLGDESRTQTFLFGRHVYVCFSVNIRHTPHYMPRTNGQKTRAKWNAHLHTHTHRTKLSVEQIFSQHVYKCCFAMLFVIWFCFVDHTFQTWNFHICVETMVAGCCWFCIFARSRLPICGSVPYHIFI